jgi:hypothetical protein
VLREKRWAYWETVSFLPQIWGDKFDGFWENKSTVVSELQAAGCQSLLPGLKRLPEFKKPVGSIIP